MHPKKRQKAASIISNEGDLRDEDIKGLLAYLALEIHEKHGEGLLYTKIAEEIVRERIEQEFDFEKARAISLARYVIQTGENAIGLLVAKSPVEIGFLHRTFQEYLAACGLSAIPYLVLSEKLERNCSDYQWHQVILALLTLTSRTEDVDDLLKRIKAKRDIAAPIDRYPIEHLLYEAALVHSKCSIEFAKAMALEAFKTVEWESWKPHRLRVSRIVLEGLRQPRLRGVVTKKIRSWYPARERYRSRLLEAMSSWGWSKEVIECLERCLNDEEGINQRAAAIALARIGAGDHDAGEKVALLSQTLEIPSARAAAIEALINGWPNHRNLEAILADAGQSPSAEIRALAIYGKVKKGIHQTDDLNRLLELGMQSLWLDYRWRDIIYQGVKLGWPGSMEVKKLCLRSVGRYSQNLDKEIAIRLLLEGYPQDEEVADFCIDEIQNETRPFLAGSLISDLWKMIAKNFRDHPGIVSAIDNWLPRQEYSEPEVSWAALVGRTPIAKAKLLELDKTHFPHWFVQTLLEGWGMSDPQVSEALTEMAYRSAAETSRIGHLLPSIVTDFAKCRRRLLDVLKDQACTRPDFVISGLQILGNTEGDTEAVEIILERLNSQLPLFERYGAMRGIFLTYSWDARVRALALKELDIHEGQYGAVAMAYKNDHEIKSRVLEIACPLPSYLRRQIMELVVRGVGDEELERSLLETYDLEFESNLKIEGSIGFHRRLKRKATLIPDHLEELRRALFCLGPQYQERRQGAFCGLVILGESEYIRSARHPWRDGESFRVPIRSGIDANISFIHFLLHNWTDCKLILFDEISEKEVESKTALWEELCLLASDYELPKSDALNFLEDHFEGIAGPNILKFIGKARPQSKLLLDQCIATLKSQGHGRYDGSEKWVAAELLVEQFGGDVEVKRLLLDGNHNTMLNSYMLMALCEGWPDSKEIEDLLNQNNPNGREFPPGVYFSLICSRANSEKVFEVVVNELAVFLPVYGRRIQLLVRPVLRRLQKDYGLLELLKSQLFGNPTSSQKVSITRLIAAGHGLSADLRNWCVDELNRQVSSEVFPELGADIFEGELRPVRHSLLDVLTDQ